ncbi:metallophosphoesterase family protein [Oceanobacillus saliphilus]|uniref:metallophosphoesterase family protein n=1 Tax=Oceanobacillus saliphilus TaxID=2925834 RepID=UPI00201E49BA|nr:DNA repair exonuclease [Oceanobacillus saliphilus]
MAKQLSFIHAADLHLDSPFKGLSSTPESIFRQIRESTFIALDRLVEAAIEKEVDFILLAGDLFDNEKQSLKAQIRLRRAFERLEQYRINVYLSYGNHDYIKGNRYPVTYPGNVFVFTEEQVSHFTFEKDDQQLAQIYGFSYENRAVLDRKAEEYKVSDETIPFHIAMLHGSILSNTEHDVYAPFQMNDLLKENFDYWALGHIHQREILKTTPPIVYPGNIQGRNRKETGEKGCYHVVLHEQDAELSFIPLQAIQFHSLTIDISECEEIHHVEKHILNAFIESESPQLMDITLESKHTSLKEWESDKLVDEVIDLVNETTMNHRNWKYIFRVSTKVNQQYDDELFKGKHFFGELSRHFDEKSIQPYVSDLYHHKQARKYLDVLSEYEETEIKEEAKQLLFNELLKG